MYIFLHKQQLVFYLTDLTRVTCAHAKFPSWEILTLRFQQLLSYFSLLLASLDYI